KVNASDEVVVTGLAAPVNDSDAATKNYVDIAVGNIDLADYLRKDGTVPLDNNTALRGRNAEDTEDINLIGLNDLNQVNIGSFSNSTLIAASDLFIQSTNNSVIGGNSISFVAEDFIHLSKQNGDATSLLFHSNEGAANLVLSIPNDLTDFRAVTLPGEA